MAELFDDMLTASYRPVNIWMMSFIEVYHCKLLNPVPACCVYFNVQLLSVESTLSRIATLHCAKTPSQERYKSV